MSWRKNLFQAGIIYRARQDIVCGNWSFKNGEEVVFEQDFYSPYDSSSAYKFRNVKTNEEKYWMLHDDEDESLSIRLFERNA